MEIFIVLFCILITLWLAWRWRITSTFEKLGIPGPKPNILFGNLLELYSKGPIKCHAEWTKKYGRVLGYYTGMTPALLISDPHLLKNIFIKDFPKFMNREPFHPITRYDPKDDTTQSVLILPGQLWKSVRSVLTPTFTAAKMKQMSGSMDSSFSTLLTVLREFADKGEVFDIHDVYQRVTLDVISKTAFGVKIDVQTNKESRILIATKLIFQVLYKDPLIFIAQSFPLLRKLCLKFRTVLIRLMFKGSDPRQNLRRGIIKVLEHRRKNPQAKGSDFLQIMIDNPVSIETGEVDLTQLEAGNTENELKSEKQVSSTIQTRNMTDGEVISSAFVVLLAGYETTSTALAFTTYYLAKHPEIQETLFQEIDDVIQNNEKLEYSTVNKLTYLDKVFCEGLRIMPPVFLFTNRYALADVQYGNIKIPKGMLIRAPTYLVHHDPEFWENPEEFNPERFSKKPNSDGITYFPFGVGPRNCLGMRFAQLEAKLVLAHIIHNFRIILSDRQKDFLPVTERIRTLSPTEGIQVKLESRNA